MERIVERVDSYIPAQPRALRVCAYARVSSGKDAMLHSLSAQVSHYSEMIQSHIGWVYCGVYSDEALTGTKSDREGFQQMLTDCRAGKIDMVITKSISRFARNTVTLLQTVRELKSMGIDVYFEEQYIHTISADGELMMTILASYAQEESRSASENQKWRIRRGFERGELVNLRFLFGYKIEKGRVAVDPEKAAVVREVFRRALAGESLTSLAIELNRRGFTGVLGGKWNSMRIREMLSNEKYLGNALLQKQYRNNHLEKKEIPNRGELPQYYAEGTHEAIIDQATFDAAQELLAGITENSPVKRPRQRSAFTSMITCTVCGRNYKRCTGGKRHFWNCPTVVQTDLPSCGTSQIPEKLLFDLAAQVLGLAQFDEGVFLERVKGIDALPEKTLVFHFKDGSTAERHWEHISRAKSWTPEMKEIARQRALAQRRGEKWQEP